PRAAPRMINLFIATPLLGCPFSLPCSRVLGKGAASSRSSIGRMGGKLVTKITHGRLRLRAGQLLRSCYGSTLLRSLHDCTWTFLCEPEGQAREIPRLRFGLTMSPCDREVH